MAINSYGYPTTIAPGDLFARYGRLMGHTWNFETEGGFRVTRITTGSTRRVTVQAGWLQAASILVQNTAAVTLDVPAPTGASQYWLLVMRLWIVDGATYKSDFAWVAGAPLQAEQTPAVTQTPGTQFDVPIALCYVTSSAALVQNVLDCRIVANSGGGVQIYEDFMMAQMRTWYGTVVYNVVTGSARMIARSSSDSAADYKKLATLDDPVPPRYGQKSAYAPTNSGVKTLSTYYWGEQVPARDYVRRVTVIVAAHVRVSEGSVWAMVLRTADPGSPATVNEGTARISQPLISPNGGGQQRPPVSITYDYILPAGQSIVFRAFLEKESGGSIEIANAGGLAGMITWIEVASGNDW